MSGDRFTPSGRTSTAAVNPIVPAQSAVMFVLEPENWPRFRAWLGPSTSTEAEDREDMKRTMSALIGLTEAWREVV